MIKELMKMSLCFAVATTCCYLCCAMVVSSHLFGLIGLIESYGFRFQLGFLASSGCCNQWIWIL